MNESRTLAQRFNHIHLSLLGKEPYNQKLSDLVILFERIVTTSVCKQDGEILAKITQIKEGLPKAVTSASARGVFMEFLQKLKETVDEGDQEGIHLYQLMITNSLVVYIDDLRLRQH